MKITFLPALLPTFFPSRMSRVLFLLFLSHFCGQLFASNSLRDDLESIYPGASDEFFQWGIEESIIDQVAETVRILNTTVPTAAPVVQSLTHANIIGFYILYRDPSIDGDRFVQLMNHLLRHTGYLGDFNGNAFLVRSRSLTIAPSWLFSALWNAVSADPTIPVDTLIETILKEARRNPRLLEGLPRVARTDKHIAMFAKLWYSFTILPSVVKKMKRPIDCRYVSARQYWVFNQNLQQDLYRYLLLKVHAQMTVAQNP